MSDIENMSDADTVIENFNDTMSVSSNTTSDYTRKLINTGNRNIYKFIIRRTNNANNVVNNVDDDYYRLIHEKICCTMVTLLISFLLLYIIFILYNSKVF